MHKFWSSVEIWQSYREFKGGNFFETQCMIMYVLAVCDTLWSVESRCLTVWWRSTEDCTKSSTLCTIHRVCPVTWWFSASVTTWTAARDAVGSRTPASLQLPSPKVSSKWCLPCPEGHPTTDEPFRLLTLESAVASSYYRWTIPSINPRKCSGISDHFIKVVTAIYV